MHALDWLSLQEACDLLRVGEDNADVIEAHCSGIPQFVELTTGYPASRTSGTDCDGMVRQLARFVLMSWFDPDGTDAPKLERAIRSLTHATKALVVARGEEG